MNKAFNYFLYCAIPICMSWPKNCNYSTLITNKDTSVSLSTSQLCAHRTLLSLDDSLELNCLPTSTQGMEIPVGAQALIDSYPKFIKGFHEGKILFYDGDSIVYDDGKEKNFETMLDNSDLEDMFYSVYSLNNEKNEPPYLSDAGRSRSESLFRKMYGDSPKDVRKSLVKIEWFGKTIEFTSINGAAEQLKKVCKELAQYPELNRYLESSGTFYWRQVRGANRLSAHSYGIAIDIGVKYSDYWRWKYPNAKETTQIKYTNRIPHKIVDIFHKYGFIWGGAWYHFDTMHFEYRPEILRYCELINNCEQSQH